MLLQENIILAATSKHNVRFGILDICHLMKSKCNGSQKGHMNDVSLPAKDSVPISKVKFSMLVLIMHYDDYMSQF